MVAGVCSKYEHSTLKQNDVGVGSNDDFIIRRKWLRRVKKFHCAHTHRNGERYEFNFAIRKNVAAVMRTFSSEIAFVKSLRLTNRLCGNYPTPETRRGASRNTPFFEEYVNEDGDFFQEKCIKFGTRRLVRVCNVPVV